MCSSCKIGKMKKGKNPNLTWTDIAWGVGGAIVGVGSNAIIAPVINKQSTQIQSAARWGVPGLKVVGGASMAMAKKIDRNWRFFGVGLGVEGGIEAAITWMPERFQINGTDVFTLIGNTSTRLPISPGATLEDDDRVFVEESISEDDMDML